eukprot:CAMPEP_0172315424 /NCGR_PEP_ID=MMETSP1058-20130122/25144_1 /TAXON_ID=83371 /ORGANISM="Detonula confervacea, Strain CCMP 353" /LENGTH=135 /DNA_ID=CAMNT_0013029501 /DNA_START=1 /DNA_END=408 /DNA_ORIENTATION=+
MSLASILLRSRLPATVASPLSSWALPTVQRAVVGACPALPQIRSVWQEVIRQVPSEDPQKVGQLTFEDPDLADARMLRANRSEAPLRRRPNFVRHEKGWMRRKRQKMERRFLRLQEGVDELKAYIKFKQENKPEY